MAREGLSGRVIRSAVGCRGIHVLIYLLISMMMLAGCDQQVEYSSSYISSYDQKKVNESYQDSFSGRPVMVRVKLFESEQATIVSQSGRCSLWDASHNRELFRLPAGRECILKRKNGTWSLENSLGENIWPGYKSVGSTIEIRPDDYAITSVGKSIPTAYRGMFRCIARDSGRFAMINVLDIESYLAGVVAAEMPAYWPEAALRAQSIAARTYALFYVNCNHNKGLWDLGSTQASQVYGGIARENDKITAILADTKGIVLAYGPKGKEKLFPAYFSAVCGGHSQDAAPVFNRSLAPLRGGPCPYCQATAPVNRFNWKPVVIAKNQASQMLINRYASLARLDSIEQIHIAQKSVYGRVEIVELIGSNGQKRNLRAEDFRLALTSEETPLLSSWYNFVDMGNAWRFEQGQGWGHGVGLCQYGCLQMAKLGRDSIAILEQYYPDAALLRAY